MSDVDRPAKRSAPTDGRSTRWDAHRARRREQLVDAALAVLGKDGRDFGLDQVALEAGVTKPVIYRYFGDRSALLDAMAERATNRLMERLMPVLYAEWGLRHRIRASVQAFLGFLEDSPNVHLLFRHRLPGQGDEVVDAGRNFIAAALAAVLGEQLGAFGIDEPDLVQVWAQSLVGAVQTTAEWWLVHGDLDRDVVTEHLVRLIWAQVDGLSRELGIVLDPDAPIPRDVEPK